MARASGRYRPTGDGFPSHCVSPYGMRGATYDVSMLSQAAFIPDKGPAGLQYLGQHGISVRCFDAVRTVLQSLQPVRQALILTCENDHGFIFTLGEEVDEIVVVKAGFASGYPGEGPRTFAEALDLIGAFGVEIEETLVPRSLMRRLESSALTVDDLKLIDKAGVVRPMRWSDYIYPWQTRLPPPPQRLARFQQAIPWVLVDPRIEDLAHRFFKNEDDCIIRGFRRLEDGIRTRTGLQDHGVRLIQRAFMQDEPLLSWRVPDAAEQKGRAQLFVGAFMAYRNPRAHRESASATGLELAEFLLLNHLFLLEADAVEGRSA